MPERKTIKVLIVSEPQNGPAVVVLDYYIEEVKDSDGSRLFESLVMTYREFKEILIQGRKLDFNPDVIIIEPRDDYSFCRANNVESTFFEDLQKRMPNVMLIARTTMVNNTAVKQYKSFFKKWLEIPVDPSDVAVAIRSLF